MSSNLPSNPRKVIKLQWRMWKLREVKKVTQVVPLGYGREDLSESEACSEPLLNQESEREREREIHKHTYTPLQRKSSESLENWFTDRFRICGRT